MSTPQNDPASTAATTPEQENAFCAEPSHQAAQGPPVRRRSGKARISDPVPVRRPEELLQHVRDRAAADDRSVSNWIRRAVEHELTRHSGGPSPVADPPVVMRHPMVMTRSSVPASGSAAAAPAAPVSSAGGVTGCHWMGRRVRYSPGVGSSSSAYPPVSEA